MTPGTKHPITGNMALFVSAILRGFGQIMLQENAVTGLLFLIGIFYGSLIMGIAAVLATFCGTATALFLKYDKSEIDKGLYGFSAALVGVAIMLFLKPALLTWMAIIIGSSVATIIQHFFINRKIPVFTLPFVLVTWLLIFFSRNYLTDTMSDPSSAIVPEIDYLTLGFKGYGQVIFQDKFVSGLLFFIAVLISSPISAVYGFIGAILSALIAFQFAVPINDIGMGLFSYNAVLCAITFAGSRIKDSIWVLLSVMLSLLFSILIFRLNIIPLTFPFVLASCITLFLKIKTQLYVNKQIEAQ